MSTIGFFSCETTKDHALRLELPSMTLLFVPIIIPLCPWSTSTWNNQGLILVVNPSISGNYFAPSLYPVGDYLPGRCVLWGPTLVLWLFPPASMSVLHVLTLVAQCFHLHTTNDPLGSSSWDELSIWIPSCISFGQSRACLGELSFASCLDAYSPVYSSLRT